jgi:hypothetical protein
VDLDHIKRKVLLWRNTPHTKGPVEDNSASKTQAPPVGPTPKSPASRPEDKEKEVEAKDKQADVESGVNELAGESSKPKPHWKIWH